MSCLEFGENYGGPAKKNQVNPRGVNTKEVQPGGTQAALLKSPLTITQSGTREYGAYSEDAPDSGIEHEGMLSAIQEVTDNAWLAARAIHRDHFIMRSRSYSKLSPLEL